MEKLVTTKSNEDYLEDILIFELENPGVEMKSTLLAAESNVSRAAIVKATKELKDKGLINKTEYGKISLTAKGRKLAQKIYHKHNTIMNLLLAVGVDQETASKECCLIEHVVSEETIVVFDEFLKKNQ